MSLADLNLRDTVNRGAVMTVLHPVERTPLKFKDPETGAEKPITITLLGKDSDEFVRAERRARQQQREAAVRRMKYSPADEDKQADVALTAATIGWEGIPVSWVIGGESRDETPAEFTKENAEKLYGNLGVRWLREAVDEFVGERANFLKS